jgi:hypothetical protein
MDQTMILAFTALIFPLLIWLIVDFGLPAVMEVHEAFAQNVLWRERVLILTQAAVWTVASIAFLIAPMVIGGAAGAAGMIAGTIGWYKLARDQALVSKQRV